MDCDYILICNPGTKEWQISFHATTLEEGRDRARELVDQLQREACHEFPFAPPIVKGVLYRGVEAFEGRVVAVKAS